MGKNYKYEISTKEGKKLNDFLNKTIIGTSYNFFNKLKRERKRTIELREDMEQECQNEVGLLDETDNENLGNALKSLTKNERLVISFIFEKQIKADIIAAKIKVDSNSVYRIKKRALRKMRRIMEVMRNEKK